MTSLVEHRDAQSTEYRFVLKTLKTDPVKGIVNQGQLQLSLSKLSCKGLMCSLLL